MAASPAAEGSVDRQGRQSDGRVLRSGRRGRKRDGHVAGSLRPPAGGRDAAQHASLEQYALVLVRPRRQFECGCLPIPVVQVESQRQPCDHGRRQRPAQVAQLHGTGCIVARGAICSMAEGRECHLQASGGRKATFSVERGVARVEAGAIAGAVQAGGVLVEQRMQAPGADRLQPATAHGSGGVAPEALPGEGIAGQ